MITILFVLTVAGLFFWTAVGALHLVELTRRLLRQRATERAITETRRRLLDWYTNTPNRGTKAHLIQKIEEACGVRVEIEKDAPGMIRIVVPGVPSQKKADQIEAAARDHMPFNASVSITWKDEVRS